MWGVGGLVSIKDYAPLPVERLEVAFDSVKLLRFASGVGDDPYVAHCAGLLGEKRDEHLLVERILELIVLDIVVDLSPVGDIIAEVIVPVDKLIVHDVIEVAGVDIECTVEISDQEKGLERSGLILGIGGGRVTIGHDKPHLGQRRTLAPPDLLKHLALGKRVIHILLLKRAGGDLGLDARNALVGILLRPCGPPL